MKKKVSFVRVHHTKVLIEKYEYLQQFNLNDHILKLASGTMNLVSYISWRESRQEVKSSEYDDESMTE
ncbi:hypothetical protein RJZ57_001473 [Blastomyces gilchristii]